jgi:hypothetical protein
MKSVEFCYWLQGFFEIAENGPDPAQMTLTPKQVEIVRRHLNMVFVHEIDPSYPAAQQNELNEMHNGNTIPAKFEPTMRC